MSAVEGKGLLKLANTRIDLESKFGKVAKVDATAVFPSRH